MDASSNIKRTDRYFMKSDRSPEFQVSVKSNDLFFFMEQENARTVAVHIAKRWLCTFLFGKRFKHQNSVRKCDNISCVSSHAIV